MKLIAQLNHGSSAMNWIPAQQLRHCQLKSVLGHLMRFLFFALGFSDASRKDQPANL
jgi:hypothetical protein